jgi:toxic protein SymE
LPFIVTPLPNSVLSRWLICSALMVSCPSLVKLACWCVQSSLVTTAKTAKTKTTSKTLRETSQRHYTVGYVSVRHEPKANETRTHYSKLPVMHLKGNWLEEAGFTTRQPVTITAKKDKLILQLAKQNA